jgi:hypothetical protein
VFGNVGTIISFKVGVNDANYLQNEFNPVFDQNDLINIENYNIYIKLLVNGEYPAPFSCKIPYDPEKFPKNKEVAETITELSRLRYGRDKGLVEAEISKRAGLDTGEEVDMSKLGKKGGSPLGGGGKGGGFKTPLKPNPTSGAKPGM